MTHEFRAHRVVIVGAGPAGIHASDALICMADHTFFVDLFDPAPAPIGLLRFANQHRPASSTPGTSLVPRLRLFGNVRVGSDITVGELTNYYDTVIVAAEDKALTVVGTSPETVTVYEHLSTTGSVTVSRTPVVSDPSPADQPGAIVAFLEARSLPFTTWTGWHRPAFKQDSTQRQASNTHASNTHASNTHATKTVSIAQWSAIVAAATSVPSVL